MKTCKLILATVLLVGLFSCTAFGAKGVVTNRIRSCDYFLVQTSSGDFVLMEWFSGYDPEKGDRVVGKFDSFGFTDVYFGERETHVWIDDYGMNKDKALEKLFDKCG
jgi:hypothetical protein